MTVFVLERAKPSVRGELNRWFLELKPGVFVGNVNTRVRELLWDRICGDRLADGAVMVYAAPTEQGFAMELFGEPQRKVVEIEGVQLIQVLDAKDNPQEAQSLDC